MAEEYGAINVHLVKDREGEGRLRLMTVVAPPRLLRETEPRQVDRDHMPSARGERRHHIAIAVGAPTKTVNQQKRGVARITRLSDNALYAIRGDEPCTRRGGRCQECRRLGVGTLRNVNQVGERGEARQQNDECDPERAQPLHAVEDSALVIGR